MASDLTADEATDITDPRVSPVDRPTLPEPKPVGAHRRRFVVIYGLLGLVLAAAIAGVVIYAGRTINPGPAWSSWKPGGGGLGAVNQIASHVAPNYRLPDGHQLVDVIVRSSSVTSGGQTVAQIGQQFSLFQDRYGMEIADGADVPLLVCLAIVIDEVSHQKD